MLRFLFLLTFLCGTALHIYFLQVNEVLKVADSFAYLQMAEYLKNMSGEGFWTGWFGFLYSLPIAIIDYVLNNNFLSAQIINIALFNFSAVLLYEIAKKYLSPKYLILLLILFFLSPILLHFNIAILSENMYLPIFLLIVLLSQRFIEHPQWTDMVSFAFLIGLMYLVRGEAFIYIWAVVILSFFALFQKKDLGFEKSDYWWDKQGVIFKWKFTQFIQSWFVLLIFFAFFVSPYVYHLHTITGEWGLSNKGSSNLRQATLRGKEKMDDEGFEQAVAEMTPDSKHLIAWFAGGLKYDVPTTNMSLKNYVFSDTQRFINNWWENQIKLYSQNLPHIILGDAGKLYFNSKSKTFYKNKIFLLTLLIPLILFLIGVINLYRNKKRDIIMILFSFFFIASIFFTLFFTLNRYFIIFIPLFLLIIVYGIQTLDTVITFSWTGFAKKNIDTKNFSWKNILKLALSALCIWIYSLGVLSYYNSHKFDDEKYRIKKEAGEYLASIKKKEDISILERFPIVTYYAETQQRWITPYTDSLKKLLIYARYNDIDYLVVDTLDFKKYRPDLQFLLDEKNRFMGLTQLKVFSWEFDGKSQKIIIYKIKK